MTLHVGARAPGHLARVASGDFDVAKLFAAGAAGFDFTDLDATKTWGPAALPLLYQTSGPSASTAMTPPATGNSVGAFLDKSQAVGITDELLANETVRKVYLGSQFHL